MTGELAINSRSFRERLSPKAKSSTALFDITIELEEDPTGDYRYSEDPGTSDDAQNAYERKIEEFARAVYQATNGAHQIRTVTVYPGVDGAKRSKKADVWWEKDCERNNGPWAKVNGFGVAGKYIHMCTTWPGSSIMETDKGGGYTLAHEWGHYAYGLYDEYADDQCKTPFGIWCGSSPKGDDTESEPSIMNNQWAAARGNRDYLEFSTQNIEPYTSTSTGENAHKRVFDESGWETLTRDPATDPKFHFLLNAKRTQYTTLFAPTDPIWIINNDEASALPQGFDIRWIAGDQVVQLAIDRSGSMSGSAITNAKTAANLLVEQLPEGDSAIGIGSFGSSVSQDFPVTVIPDPDTGVKSSAKSAVNGLSTGGVTSLYDGLISALNEVKTFQGGSTLNGTPVVFVLSDGGDNDSSATESSVISAYQQAGVPIIAFAYGSFAPTGTLRTMADSTGGALFVTPTTLPSIQEALFGASASFTTSLLMKSSSSSASANAITEQVVSLDSTLKTALINITFDGALDDLSFAFLLPSGADSGKSFECSDNGDVSCTLSLDEAFLLSNGSGDYKLRIDNAGSNKEVSILVSGTPANAEPYDMVVSVNDVNYPDPFLIRATVLRGILPLAGVEVTATLTKPDNTEFTLSLRDDGAGADNIAGDGVYSASIGYDQDGIYNISVEASNGAGTAVTSYQGISVSPTADGTTVEPTPVSIPENFTRFALATGNVSGVLADDHADYPSLGPCTLFEDDNRDTVGRIDSAGDVDCFAFTPTSANNPVVIRVTSLVSDMEPVLTIYDNVGSSVITTVNLASSEEVSLGVVKTLNLFELDPAGHVITVEHTNPNVAMGGYAVSAEPQLTANATSGFDHCAKEAYRVESRNFSAGRYTLGSEQRLTVAGTAQVGANGTLSLAAPMMSFEPGFTVLRGGVFAATAGTVMCISANSSKVAETAELPEAAPDAGRVIEADRMRAPALIFTDAKALPEWLQSLLAGLGINMDAIDSLLLDADGQWVVFETNQSLATMDTNSYSDVYRLDLLSQQAVLISTQESGQAGNGPSRYPAVDSSGELIVFHSEADNLVARDTNKVSDIFLHDFALRYTERLTDASAASARPGVDAGGTDIVYDQLNADGKRAVMALDLFGVAPAEQLSLLRMSSDRALLDNHHPAISADGRYVAYLEQEQLDQTLNCQVHIFDRDTEAYHRQPCPQALTSATEESRAAFSTDGNELYWLLPDQIEPITVSNPLHR